MASFAGHGSGLDLASATFMTVIGGTGDSELEYQAHALGADVSQPPSDGNVAPMRPKKKFPPEDAIADIFAEEHKHDLRYVAAWGKWFEWRNGCWREEKTLKAFHLIRKTCTALGANRAVMAKTVGTVHALARADRRLAATVEQWDGRRG